MQFSSDQDFSILHGHASPSGATLLFAGCDEEGNRAWIRPVQSGSSLPCHGMPLHPGILPRQEFPSSATDAFAVYPYLIGIPFSLFLHELGSSKALTQKTISDVFARLLPPGERNGIDERFWSQEPLSLVCDLAKQLVRVLRAANAGPSACCRVTEEDFLVTPFGRLILLEPAQATSQSLDSLHGAGPILSRWIGLLGPQAPDELRKIAYAADPEYPADGYGSLEEMEQDLARFEEGLPVFAKRPGAVLRAVRSVRKDPRKKAAALLFFALTAAAAFWLAFEAGQIPWLRPSQKASTVPLAPSQSDSESKPAS